MIFRAIAFAALALSLAACTTVRITSPVRSAQEELLISTAADRAAESLAAQVPSTLSVFIDDSALLGSQQTTDPDRADRDYAVAAIRDALLRHGVRVMPERALAEAVIVPRASALATYEKQTLVGIPALPAPVPAAALAGVTMPALSLYQDAQQKGVAKFAASVYDPKTGKLIVSTDPSWGFSRHRDGVVLFFFSWNRNDYGVDFDENPPAVKPAK